MDGNRKARSLSAHVGWALILLLLAWGSAPSASAAGPLSQDDITLLLIGGASEQKMVALVEQRGVDFQLTPQLVEKLRKRGATNALIDAIVKSNRERAAQNSNQPVQAAPPTGESPGIGPQIPGLNTGPRAIGAPAAGSQAAGSNASSPENPHMTIRPAGPKPAQTTPTAELKDPTPERIQQIIQAFAAKEQQFKEARDNYTYHQINKVETLNADGNVDGTWEQDWDILFNDQGKRIEHVTYAPVPTLTRLMVTKEDLDAFRSIQPFVLTTSEVPEYDIQYLGHVRVDYITAYVFSVRPKEIKKGRQYFKGQVWVDDRDLQIVKAQGRNVPELKTKHGENLFPHFTTWRQQIDGKYWFPTYTMADDTLYFDAGPVRIREIVRYTDYKQFRSSSRILAVSPDSTAPKNEPTPEPKKK
jgi:hypothetical protein